MYFNYEKRSRRKGRRGEKGENEKRGRGEKEKGEQIAALTITHW